MGSFYKTESDIGAGFGQLEFIQYFYTTILSSNKFRQKAKIYNPVSSQMWMLWVFFTFVNIKKGTPSNFAFQTFQGLIGTQIEKNVWNLVSPLRENLSFLL